MSASDHPQPAAIADQVGSIVKHHQLAFLFMTEL
jgi:hypothetical protein